MQFKEVMKTEVITTGRYETAANAAGDINKPCIC